MLRYASLIPALLFVVGASFTSTAADAADSTCTLPSVPATLFHLSPHLATYLNATASECCTLCATAANSRCESWSFSGHKWTPATPCHLSPYAAISKTASPGEQYSGGSNPNAPPAPAPSPPSPSPSPPAPHVNPGTFIIDTSVATGHKQVFEGIQVELMADSIGSYNEGMPGDGNLVPDDDNTTRSAPHDLAPSERIRFAVEVMQGVRTIRLAMGLYLRGLTPDKKNIIGRWPSQMAELRQLQDLSGVDGWAPEYWSPPSGWKSRQSYYGGTLASFNESFLDDFSDGVITDVKYLQSEGLRIKWWGLQNEPDFSHTNVTARCNRSDVMSNSTQPSAATATANSYATCSYSQCSYYFAFEACAKKIRQLDPAIRIHANSATGQLGASPVANDPNTLALVDAWTWHRVNQGSEDAFNDAPYNYGKLDFNNEMEYQPGSPYAGSAVGTVSNVNMFLNTLKFKNSPTGVMMLHAAKPTTNLESLGYGWTWWRSTGDNSTSPNFPDDLKQNHFAYNWWNWNSVAPFIKTVPWNSIRLDVAEDVTRLRQRVVAFQTPAVGQGGPLHTSTAAGKLILVLTNEAAVNFSTTVGTNDGVQKVWSGYSFHGAANNSTFNISLGTKSSGGGGVEANEGSRGFETTLAPYTIQWWYEQ